ncbi:MULTISPECIES: polyprenyl synthetase family protein [Streptococcus]|uniref:Farnesyl diphosphate synthase n=1 Tax=Streptococcus australis ATCC 700641 TaxID=888833 RepID=E7SCU7_9STRE|nr:MULTISPECIES: farnesyl diphosphate synthase [Streptococcus]EFV98671.1 polyprenyl synthetase [Streptococcus australis ATCC 700641]EGU66086.1 geranyltranstransferase [Streptococcus australis ATCC 700641]RSK05708.1 Farnesyl diphosphate synthase [Streptococcus sp. A12]SQH65938.1 geranyltranstransferase [Streptococcus australis]
MILEEKLQGVEKEIEGFYEAKQIAPRLVESILYSVRAGGKRIRPLLLLELLEAFHAPILEAHFQVAAALEMIHTGSLIHDDLPAMDNDDYRRGQLTNHKKFGEDLAILAGDSLFLDAFGCVAEADLPASIQVQLIALLSDASGTAGMVAGQVLDMEGEGASLTLDQLQVIHANKTGRLLAYPFQAAGILLELEPAVATLLEEIGIHLGLAFQIRDDILDVTADFASLGKTPQKDLHAEKSTYPALLGLDGAQAYLDRELDACEDLLDHISNQVSFEGTGIKNIIERLRIHGQGKS